MEKLNNTIHFKERKKEMMYREEQNKIDGLAPYFKNTEIPECVEARLQETCREILESSAKKG